MADRPGGLVAGFLRLVLKLFLASIALVFAVCLLLVGLIAVLFSLLKALMTWQKPAPWVVFRQVQKYSARGQWPNYANENENESGNGKRGGEMKGNIYRDATGGTHGNTNRQGSNNISGFPARNRQASKSADVVDVEVREIPPADNKG